MKGEKDRTGCTEWTNRQVYNQGREREKTKKSIKMNKLSNTVVASFTTIWSLIVYAE